MKAPAWLRRGGWVYYFSDLDFSECPVEKNPRCFLSDLKHSVAEIHGVGV